MYTTQKEAAARLKLLLDNYKNDKTDEFETRKFLSDFIKRHYSLIFLDDGETAKNIKVILGTKRIRLLNKLLEKKNIKLESPLSTKKTNVKIDKKE